MLSMVPGDIVMTQDMAAIVTPLLELCLLTESPWPWRECWCQARESDRPAKL